MSKTNPNQDHYKTGGRTQTDGPDRADAGDKDSVPTTPRVPTHEKNANHPAVQRSKRK
jgi:hypothetical protein